MSYSTEHKCNTCGKASTCIDRHYIQAAVAAIHSFPWPGTRDGMAGDVRHKGGGVVRIECNMHEAAPPAA